MLLCLLVLSQVRDFVYITDKAYSRAEILHMEGVVLNALKFDLTVATPLVFLKRFLKAAKADERVTNLAHYFTERMLQVCNVSSLLPQKLAHTLAGFWKLQSQRCFVQNLLMRVV